MSCGMTFYIYPSFPIFTSFDLAKDITLLQNTLPPLSGTPSSLEGEFFYFQTTPPLR